MIKNVNINTDESKLWQYIWDIYTKSFPIFEQRTVSDQRDAMKDERFKCKIYLEDDNIIGILFYWEWDKYRYIEHFAICSELRGKNYGSRLLKELCDSDKIIILEIDPPVDDTSIRRLRFYKNLGFKLNDYIHVHPPYRGKFEGHKLNVLSYKDILSKEEYESFNLFLKNEVMKYSE